jgi:hypothetical protein
VPKRGTILSFFNQNSRKRTKSSPSPFAHGSNESRRDQLKCKTRSNWDDTSSLFLIGLAKSFDFGSAHQLIKRVVDQISELRTDTDFSELFREIAEFSIEHGIDLRAPIKQSQRKVSLRLADSLVTGTLGQRDKIGNETQYRTRIHYAVIDSILAEINASSPLTIWEYFGASRHSRMGVRLSWTLTN